MLVDIEALLLANLHGVLPKSLLGQALHYLSSQWSKLKRYAEDGRYSIDNNVQENAIRPFCVGRRNWLFADTVHGANASANLYEPGIPVDLRWQGEPFLALGSLPASLTLNNWQLQLLGNLEEGYLLQSTASLPGDGGTVLLEVDGEVTTTGVPLLAVQMHVADAPARRFALQADASWQQTLEANGELALDAFPWQWLYPVDTGEVSLQQLAMVWAHP